MNRHIQSALLIAGSIMAGALGLRYLTAHGFISGDQHELSTRAYNFSAALIAVWWTNLAPKRLRPLAELRADPATEQSVRRFASTAIVGAALLSALAWLVAPVNLALPLEMVAIGSVLIFVFLRRFFR